MLVPRKKGASSRKKMLADIKRISAELADGPLATLHEFAEYLGNKYPCEESRVQEPVAIPRPGEESVVAAIRRLTRTYPMLDRERLFEQSSAVMSTHILNGLPAQEAIDRLEEIFSAQYEDFLGRSGSSALGSDESA